MRTIAVEEEHLNQVNKFVMRRKPVKSQKLTSNWSTKASMPALSPVKYLGCAILLVVAEKKCLSWVCLGKRLALRTGLFVATDKLRGTRRVRVKIMNNQWCVGTFWRWQHVCLEGSCRRSDFNLAGVGWLRKTPPLGWQHLVLFHVATAGITDWRCYEGDVLASPPFILNAPVHLPPTTELLYREADGTVVKATVVDEVIADEMLNEIDAILEEIYDDTVAKK
jgi:hypothetical protein